MSSTVVEGVPRYRAIYENLRSKARTVGPNGKRIGSYRDISNEFGVTPSTVVRAINMLKDEGWAYGEKGKGTYLVTKPLRNGVAQIAFISSSLDGGTSIRAKNIDMSFDHKRYSLAVYSAHSNLEKFKYTVEHICETNPAGIIFYNLLGDLLEIDFSSIIEAGIPTVVLGEVHNNLICDRVEHTCWDSVQKIATCLLKNNSRNIATILDPLAKRCNASFLEMLSKRLSIGGVEFGENNVFYCDSSRGYSDDPDQYIDIYEFAKKHCDRWQSFDTVVFTHDYAAVGFLRAALEMGIKVPEQLKIISGMKNPVNGASPMNLTTVDTNIEEQSYIAVELLKRRIEGYDGPQEVHYVAGELIEGETT